MDQDIILYILKSVIATIVMSAFLLYFDLSKQAWMDYELVERVMNLFLLIIFSALIYFAFLYWEFYQIQSFSIHPNIGY